MPHAIDVSLDASIDAVMSVQPDVDAFCETHGLSPKASYVLNLVLEELLTNVVNHGYRDHVGGPIILRLSKEGPNVVGEIVDAGRAFDPTTLPEPDTEASLDDRQIGGLGVHLSKTMTAGLTYARIGDQNVTRFVLADEDPPRMEDAS